MVALFYKNLQNKNSIKKGQAKLLHYSYTQFFRHLYYAFNYVIDYVLHSIPMYTALLFILNNIFNVEYEHQVLRFSFLSSFKSTFLPFTLQAYSFCIHSVFASIHPLNPWLYYQFFRFFNSSQFFTINRVYRQQSIALVAFLC